MPGMKDPHDADFKEASSQLAAGIKSCRSVVENYRAMLSGETDEGQTVGPEDSGDAPGEEVSGENS